MIESGMDFKLFKKIAELPGVSGREEVVRAELLKLFKTCADEVRVDTMGSIIAYKKGKGVRKLLLAAHMDEIGLMVNHIDDGGFLRFITIGGIDPRTLMAQRVTVHTAKGPVTGVIGTKPVHLLDAGEAAKAISLKNLFIDIGMPADKARALVSVGDTVSLERAAVEFGDGFINSKSIDDRVGVYILYEALNRVKKFDCDIYAAINVQEEVGLRGAVTSTYGIDPDIGLVVDATAANDLPATPPQEFNCQVGKGVAITIIDSSTIANPQIVKTLTALAKKRDIRHQFKISAKGGNDAGAIHKTKSGVPTGILSLPARYIHSSIETSSKADIDAAIDLTVAFIEECCKHSFDF
ncbi:endoglucanase [Elusimicrobium simillimum]|uniref:M42 family metallopeptidase n=1 Tax=Elusimicrobium simillimum TaxID=3143438 RepID=UPI003C6F1D91